MQDDVNHHTLRMSEGTFSLGAAHIVKMELGRESVCVCVCV